MHLSLALSPRLESFKARRVTTITCPVLWHKRQPAAPDGGASPAAECSGLPSIGALRTACYNPGPATRPGYAMQELPSDAPESRVRESRLDSWKEIAAYLRRDVSTVQRWEKREGMPVHRHLHDKLGSVYALPSELDAWSQSRTRSAERETPVVDAFWPNPLAGAQFAPITDFEGAQQAAAISRDGKFVAFLSNRDGRTDVWITQIGGGQFYNLTRGTALDVVNPDVRALCFSPDGALVMFWARTRGGSAPGRIGIWAVPTRGTTAPLPR